MKTGNHRSPAPTMCVCAAHGGADGPENGSRRIDEQELQYLLSEFAESFKHMGKLDDRRFQILQFYASFITAVLAASVAILGLDALESQFRALGVALLLSLASIVSWASGQVVTSERRATERYRNKLNAVRKVVLRDDSSPELKAFFAQGRDISVDTASIEPKDLRFFDIFRPERRCTALYIKVLIDLGMALSLVAAVAVMWIGYF